MNLNETLYNKWKGLPVSSEEETLITLLGAIFDSLDSIKKELWRPDLLSQFSKHGELNAQSKLADGKLLTIRVIIGKDKSQ